MNGWIDGWMPFQSSLILSFKHLDTECRGIVMSILQKKTVANSVATDVSRNHFVSLRKDFCKLLNILYVIISARVPGVARGISRNTHHSAEIFLRLQNSLFRDMLPIQCYLKGLMFLFWFYRSILILLFGPPQLTYLLLYNCTIVQLYILNHKEMKL